MENTTTNYPSFNKRHNLKYSKNYHNKFSNNFNNTFSNNLDRYRHKNIKNIFCVNCGEQGHIVKECKAPITSYGIIAFKVNNSPEDDLNDKNKDLNDILKKEFIIDNNNSYPKIKFLMIQRKDTIGYIDFLRGKYTNIQTCIDEMTYSEKINILTKPFDDLWNDLWVCNRSHENFYKQEYNQAKKKFNQININELLINPHITKFNHTEFGFPKGRREIKEQNLDCAEREFFEETGYNNQTYDFLKDYPVIEEQFKGTNGITYKHIYYLVKMKESCLKPNVIDSNNIIQASEVRNVGWFTFHESCCLIRPYDEEKKNILKKIYTDLLNMNNIFII